MNDAALLVRRGPLLCSAQFQPSTPLKVSKPLFTKVMLMQRHTPSPGTPGEGWGGGSSVRYRENPHPNPRQESP